MKRRWRAAIGLVAVVATTILIPVVYIEGGCRAPLPGATADSPYRAILEPRERRPEGRTWLTYPEWHIVYEADSYARHLSSGARPSGFAFGSQIASFWSSYCTVNRLTRGSASGGDAKVMIYTIGISYSVELAVKAAYENTIGRLSEWLGGWHSADDRYAAAVQARYGAFMHETPWYRFPFGEAFAGAWRTREPNAWGRHWERRFASSAEFGVKAGYAKLIDAATGATLGRDELTLRLVARGSPAQLTAIDRRLKAVRVPGADLTVLEAPRYAQFTDIVARMARAGATLVEIAGNDDIFVTLLQRNGTPPPKLGTVLMTMPAAQAGWQRVGVSVKVTQLLDLVRVAVAGDAVLEHVYDY
nr:hypothetical protein [uncultured Sphingomonas sp.]